jgi:hypothetical protein
MELGAASAPPPLSRLGDTAGDHSPDAGQNPAPAPTPAGTVPPELRSVPDALLVAAAAATASQSAIEAGENTAKDVSAVKSQLDTVAAELQQAKAELAAQAASLLKQTQEVAVSHSVSELHNSLPVLSDEDKKKAALFVKAAAHIRSANTILGFTTQTAEHTSTVKEHLDAASRLTMLGIALVEIKAEYKNWTAVDSYRSFMMPIADKLGSVDDKYAHVQWQTYDRALMRKCNENDKKDKAHVAASQQPNRRSSYHERGANGYGSGYQHAADRDGAGRSGGGYKRPGPPIRDDHRAGKR